MSETCKQLTIVGGFVAECGAPAIDGNCVMSYPHLQTKSGRFITFADIEEYVNEAEQGYDPVKPLTSRG